MWRMPAGHSRILLGLVGATTPLLMVGRQAPQATGSTLPTAFFLTTQRIEKSWRELLVTVERSLHQPPQEHPPITSSISYVQANDGTSKTLMLSESVHPWFYAYDGDTAETYAAGASASTDISPIQDAKTHLWLCMEQQSGVCFSDQWRQQLRHSAATSLYGELRRSQL